MATQLQIRRGTAAQVAAFTGAEGEIVYNSTNDSLHTNDGSTAGGFELARADGANFALTSAISTTANFSFGDNDKAIFGAGSDLQIYHDGSHSYIKDTATGNLRIDGTDIQIRSTAGANMAAFVTGAEVQLYHNNQKKFETTASGIDVTGLVAADSLTVDNITIDGTTIALSSGDLTLDVAGDIILDADGGDLIFRDGGSSKLVISNTSDDVTFTNGVQDKDLIFKGYDGVSLITSLKLDMSAAGAATFNSTIAAGAATFTTADNSAQLTLVSTDTDANAGPHLNLYRNTTGSDSDALGQVEFTGKDDAGNDFIYAQIEAYISDASNGSEDGYFEIFRGVGGTERVSGMILSSTDTVFNENSADIDFRVESDTNTHALFLQGSDGSVGIGTSSPRSLINASSATGAILTLESSDTSLGEGNVVGQINFYANDASTNSTGNKAFIKAYSETAGGNKVGLDFATSSSTSSTGVTAMTIGSSGKVGIGTVSPSAPLAIEGSPVATGDTRYELIISEDNTLAAGRGGGLAFARQGVIYGGIKNTAPGWSDNNTDMHFQTRLAGTVANKMVIKSSGSVGISTVSPTEKLHVEGNVRLADAGSIQFGSSKYQTLTGQAGSNDLLYRTYANHIFKTTTGPNNNADGTERMRISGGNVLVGTTNINPSQNAVEGIALSAGSYGGYLSAARNGGVVAQFARLTNDGAILDFRNSTGSAGSIGTLNSDLTIGSGDTGLRFNSANDFILPFNTTTNASRDAAIDLGLSTTRFKDAYLSGGIYLGGTGAANKLDDYEEGTWTPTLTTDGTDFTSVTYDAGVSGTYTKVGRVVTVDGFMRTDAITKGSASGFVQIGGLPFAATGAISVGNVGGTTAWLVNSPTNCQNAGAKLYLTYGANSTAFINLGDVATAVNDNEVRFQVTYQAS